MEGQQENISGQGQNRSSNSKAAEKLQAPYLEQDKGWELQVGGWIAPVAELNRLLLSRQVNYLCHWDEGQAAELMGYTTL